MGVMRQLSAFAALFLLMGAVLGASLESAQPTFGRPKPDKKKSNPRQTDPTPVMEPGEDTPTAPAPDEPEEPLPIDEPSSSSSFRFVASPEEWLETDPPRQAPAANLTPGETYAWRSSDGLRYSFTVPANYRPDDSAGYDVVIICHPRGDDFRWGAANHLSAKAAVDRGSARLAFRPNNFVVCVDGVGALPTRPKFRSFPSSPGAMVRFRDFVLELTRSLPARRFYLYGFGGGDGEDGDGAGGRFVLEFARQFPALADGVIAYGSGWSEDVTDRLNVPVVIMHGVKNGLVPLSSAMQLHSDYVELGSKLVRLRPLRAFNDYPNPVRVSECIDWLAGARTDSPAEALAAIEAMLTPKGGDEYDYVAPVWYAGAREILGRILDEQIPLAGEAPFEGNKAPSDEIKTRARAIVQQIDDAARAHIAALRTSLPDGKLAADLVLDGGPWLGHLIAARDDFRGVAPMEQLAESLKFDSVAAEHAAIGRDLVSEWTTRTDEDNFALVVAMLPKCFFYEGLPVNMPSRMKAWRRKSQSGELALPADQIEGFENVTNWDDGVRKGLDEYQRIWRVWRFEPAPASKPAEKAAP